MYQYFSNNGYGGYPQPMQTPVPIQQSQTTTFINVPSEDVAFRWNVSPNNSVNFINENQGYLYKKSVGMSILEPPVFEVYRIEKIGDNVPAPVQETSPPDLSEYMTKSEFESYKTIIDDMQKIVKELNGNG